MCGVWFHAVVGLGSIAIFPLFFGRVSFFLFQEAFTFFERAFSFFYTSIVFFFVFSSLRADSNYVLERCTYVIGTFRRPPPGFDQQQLYIATQQSVSSACTAVAVRSRFDIVACRIVMCRVCSWPFMLTSPLLIVIFLWHISRTVGTQKRGEGQSDEEFKMFSFLNN